MVLSNDLSLSNYADMKTFKRYTALLSAVFASELTRERIHFSLHRVAELQKRWQSFRKIRYGSTVIVNAMRSIFEIMGKSLDLNCVWLAFPPDL